MPPTKTKKPARAEPLPPDACTKTTKAAALSFAEALATLGAWRRRCPSASRLDGQTSGRNNLKPWLYMRIDGFSSPRHDVLAKHSGELITGQFYNGTWNLHGDTSAAAVDLLLKLCAKGTDPAAVLLPTATHQTKAEHSGQQNPKLTLPGEGHGFFLYQS